MASPCLATTGCCLPPQDLVAEMTADDDPLQPHGIPALTSLCPKAARAAAAAQAAAKAEDGPHQHLPWAKGTRRGEARPREQNLPRQEEDRAVGCPGWRALDKLDLTFNKQLTEWRNSDDYLIRAPPLTLYAGGCEVCSYSNTAST